MGFVILRVTIWNTKIFFYFCFTLNVSSVCFSKELLEGMWPVNTWKQSTRVRAGGACPGSPRDHSFASYRKPLFSFSGLSSQAWKDRWKESHLSTLMRGRDVVHMFSGFCLTKWGRKEERKGTTKPWRRRRRESSCPPPNHLAICTFESTDAQLLVVSQWANK